MEGATEDDDEQDDENEVDASGEEDDDHSDDTDGVDDDDAEVEVAQDVEYTQVEKGDKGKGTQENPDNAEASEKSAKDDDETAEGNITEVKVKNKDKCLSTARRSLGTDNDDAELVDQTPLPDATA